ncbi:MAG: phosphoenolpyruvate--protein phosphotransferase [Ignavibacteria bacterium]|nr:phosphoenolpyruvate--protein phosphotransferase [Ignavibacteria bacterium]
MIKEKIFKGIPASPGITIGKAYLYTKNQIRINVQNLDDSEIENEIEEFNRAIELSRKELNKIFTISKERIGEQQSKIFDAQIEILNDTIFINSVIERIRKEKRSASYIFNNEINKLGKILLSANDDYMKERFADINDVKNRVVRNMKREKLVSKVDEDSVIVAHELTPADTILFSRRKVQGYATDTGGITSHAAIISRALRVPAVVGIKVISKAIKTGDSIIIDGFEGVFILNPEKETIKKYRKKFNEYAKHEKKLLKIIDLPCETLDKKIISITANIEFNEEVDFIAKYGHCGIGLYRTEHLFIEKGDFPSEQEQIEEYVHIANLTYPNPVIIRTFDIGGDKLLPSSLKESNPFLGWRGIRICLDRIQIFREQLKALLLSSTKGNIKIMLPMISSLDEVKKSKEILNEVKQDLDSGGLDYDRNIQLGIMIEVPSACMLADELAKEVDFFSIGTNDLIQYLLAVDRGNEMISNMFQEFHPAVIRALKKIIDSAHKNNIIVSICGEMASVPVATSVLIGLGIDELSVIPSVLPEIKQIIRVIKMSEAESLADSLLQYSTEGKIRNEVVQFYEKKIKPKLPN